MTTIEQSTVDAVLAHMNGDHAADNLVIARAYGSPDADTAVMAGLDTASGHWEFGVDGVTRTLSLPWSSPIVARQDIRREVVVVFERACAALGIPVSVHE